VRLRRENKKASTMKSMKNTKGVGLADVMGADTRIAWVDQQFQSNPAFYFSRHSRAGGNPEPGLSFSRVR